MSRSSNAVEVIEVMTKEQWEEYYIQVARGEAERVSYDRCWG